MSNHSCYHYTQWLIHFHDSSPQHTRELTVSKQKTKFHEMKIYGTPGLCESSSIHIWSLNHSQEDTAVYENLKTFSEINHAEPKKRSFSTTSTGFDGTRKHFLTTVLSRFFCNWKQQANNPVVRNVPRTLSLLRVHHTEHVGAYHECGWCCTLENVTDRMNGNRVFRDLNIEFEMVSSSRVSSHSK